MNYSELVSTVKAYTENDFPTTLGTGGLTSTQQIDTFIKQAERRIYNSVQLLDLRKSVTGSFTDGNRYLTVPTDWLSTFSLAVIDGSGNYTYLLNRDVNYIREAYPDPTAEGLPVVYAYFDKDSFIVGPTPDANYSCELYYFYYPETIVTATNTWLGDNFDQALLYGTLLEAYLFMKGEPDIYAAYQQRYDSAMEQLQQYAEGKNRQDAYRSGQVRRQGGA